ncbi:MAG: hypothetical protein Q8L81_04505 [Bacteroidota bacterium]|nr:hypothetical protein [Bacteroidota bacterium]
MAKKSSDATYDHSCFMVLAYEYGDNKIKESEKKIRAKLKYNKLGAYDEARVNKLRELTEELSAEIRLQNRSTYFSKSNNEFSNMEDFDFKKWAEDLSINYPTIDKKELDSLVGMAVHLFHCR